MTAKSYIFEVKVNHFLITITIKEFEILFYVYGVIFINLKVLSSFRIQHLQKPFSYTNWTKNNLYQIK